MPPRKATRAMDEMLSRLLAVGDDVDAAIFLQLDREQRGIALPATRSAPFSFHGAQSLLGSASHSGLGSEPAIVAGKAFNTY